MKRAAGREGVPAEGGHGESGADDCVALLRAALRAGEDEAEAEGEEAGRRAARRRAAAAEAARPVIDRLYKTLLSYCDYLVWHSDMRGHMDGADLAQDTWGKCLRYLLGSGGDRVCSETHLRRILRVAAKQRLLDAMSHDEERRRLERSVPEHWGDRDEATGVPLERYEDATAARALNEALGLFAEGPYAELIEALFTSEGKFRSLCQQPARRRARQYRAFVAYQLGAFLRCESRRDRTGDAADGGLDEGFARLMREYVQTLGIPPEQWQAVEEAVRAAPPMDAAGDAHCRPLLEAVNRLWGTDLTVGNTMSVLRHELNQFVGATPAPPRGEPVRGGARSSKPKDGTGEERESR